MASLLDYTGITKLRDAWEKIKANTIAINNELIALGVEVDAIVTGSANAEVGQAHISDAKSTTYTTIDGRFEAIETDILDNLSDNNYDDAAVVEVAKIIDKADITYVDSSVANLADGSPKGIYATLVALEAAYPTGTTGIYIVAADGHWYYWNVSAWTDGGVYQATGIPNGGIVKEQFKSNAITRNMLGIYLPVNTNLFDKVFATVNYHRYQDGVYTVNATYAESDYIPCLPDDYFIGSTNSFFTFWDVDKNFVSGVLTTNCQIPSGTGICYFRSVCLTANLNTNIVASGQVLPTYSAYKAKDTDLIIDETNLSPIINIPAANIHGSLNYDAIVPPHSIQGVNVSLKNLLNKATITHGSYHRHQDNVYTVNAAFCESDYIPCIGSTEYIHNANTFQNFYDINKKWISGNLTNPFTTPSNAKYVKLEMLESTYTTTMLVAGTVYPSAYTAYKCSLDPDYFTPNRWFDKLWAALGDSITAANRYQPLVVSKTGLICNSYGLGSSTIAVNTSSLVLSFCERINTLATADLISIFGGVNDFYKNTPIGTIGSTDNTTFYGALYYLIDYLNTNMPDAQPVFFTPLYWGTVTGIGTNSVGCTLKDYRDAIIAFGIAYSIPVLDLFSVSGLNSFNYVANTSDGLHPNDMFTAKYYTKISGFMNSL